MPRVSKASRQAGIIYRKLSLRLPVRDIATIKAAADREKKTLQAYVADAPVSYTHLTLPTICSV